MHHLTGIERSTAAFLREQVRRNTASWNQHESTDQSINPGINLCIQYVSKMERQGRQWHPQRCLVQLAQVCTDVENWLTIKQTGATAITTAASALGLRSVLGLRSAVAVVLRRSPASRLAMRARGVAVLTARARAGAGRAALAVAEKSRGLAAAAAAAGPWAALAPALAVAATSFRASGLAAPFVNGGRARDVFASSTSSAFEQPACSPRPPLSVVRKHAVGEAEQRDARLRFTLLSPTFGSCCQRREEIMNLATDSKGPAVTATGLVFQEQRGVQKFLNPPFKFETA